MTETYAAIGIDVDGTTPVVWGIGKSEVEACQDAGKWFAHLGGGGRAWSTWGWATTTIPPETVCEIMCGEVRCAVLGIGIGFNCNGRIESATPPTEVNLEAAAVRWRAETGIVPYWLFYALPYPTRMTISGLTQTAARKRAEISMAVRRTMLNPCDVMIGD